ncbi:endonuclease/exonuclease/phosphatase family protein [Ectopseudomonas mendocina]|nr:endonuclease/exonuclease/phosphatase family protein [Pseudomonas mendocina]TRO25147.1 endonuclease/exonuclease/phosphatase family protein [Pseudomonas mendocina]TRO29030.1 endonuclease/exonuclease/phosphatase family protein [Pseudomonas mendocina]
MRLVSWNCNGAFRKKLNLLEGLNADVFVIQECEDPAQCSDAHYKQWAANHLWVGNNRSKGLGVFARPGILLEPLDLNPGNLQLFLPLRIDQITLLAVWTKEAGSPTFKYIGQLYKWLQSHKAHLDTPKAMVVGDLNSNACWDVWDRWWNHSDVVRELEGLGLLSLYHTQTGEPQGGEAQPTFFLHRKPERPYHIDYAFLSEMLMTGARISIGDTEHWLEHSDHLPLVVDIAPGVKR